MEIKKYSSYLTEALDLDEINEKIGESFTELKIDLIDLINDTLEESDDIKHVSEKDLNEFLTNYIAAGKDVDMIDELIEDNDIFNFYLKHQSDFDELLNDNGYMGKTPEQNGVFSLYDIIIDGTKQGIVSLMEILQTDLF